MDTLTLVQKTIRNLKANGCSDTQVVGILLGMGDSPPDATTDAGATAGATAGGGATADG